MRNPRPQGSVPPARTGLDSASSDEGLAAAVRAGADRGDARPVAALLARHWQPVHDYAAIGTPSAKAAALLTTAAFSRVLENLRRVRTTAALRPLLLLTARHIAKGWAADERVTALPELQNPETGRTVPVGMFTLPENRLLVSRAFLALPGPAQCLLWHTEAEAEDISLPSGLLAMHPRGAAVQLGQAHEMLRAGILRAHLEIAPECECRHYNRLLDVSLRRGGELPPDMRSHPVGCPHCRFAAEQLDHRDGRLPLLLAQAVLGPAAQPYLDSRPTRRNARYQARAAAVRGTGRRPAGAAPPERPERSAAGPPAPRRPRGRGLSRQGRSALVTGVGAATGLLVAATVVSGLQGGDTDGVAAPAGTASASPVPSDRVTVTPGPLPSATAAAHPPGPVTIHFHHAGSGLCLDLREQRARRDAAATTADCSHSLTQKWIHEQDGLLRSAAAPGLCLNSRSQDGVLTLTPCKDGRDDRDDRDGKDSRDGGDGKGDRGGGDGRGDRERSGGAVRYDLTVRGQLIPHWDGRLAVAPGSSEAGADVVARPRDGSRAQRWLTHASVMTPRLTPRAATGTADTREVEASAPAERRARSGPGAPLLPELQAPARGSAGGAPRSARSDRVWDSGGESGAARPAGLPDTEESAGPR
ncbi:ricin-type beta-trefoil lectin domain protein [Streptomyces sp. NPDC001889]